MDESLKHDANLENLEPNSDYSSFDAGQFWKPSSQKRAKYFKKEPFHRKLTSACLNYPYGNFRFFQVTCNSDFGEIKVTSKSTKEKGGILDQVLLASQEVYGSIHYIKERLCGCQCLSICQVSKKI